MLTTVADAVRPRNAGSSPADSARDKAVDCAMASTARRVPLPRIDRARLTLETFCAGFYHVRKFTAAQMQQNCSALRIAGGCAAEVRTEHCCLECACAVAAGKSEFKEPPHLMMVARLQSRDSERVVFRNFRKKGTLSKADEEMAVHVEDLLKRWSDAVEKVTLYLTYQPTGCCDRLLALYDAHLRGKTLVIKVSHLRWLHWLPGPSCSAEKIRWARGAIKRLMSAEGDIRVQAMRAGDWRYLWSLVLPQYDGSSRRKLDEFVGAALSSIRNGGAGSSTSKSVAAKADAAPTHTRDESPTASADNELFSNGRSDDTDLAVERKISSTPFSQPTREHINGDLQTSGSIQDIEEGGEINWLDGGTTTLQCSAFCESFYHVRKIGPGFMGTYCRALSLSAPTLASEIDLEHATLRSRCPLEANNETTRVMAAAVVSHCESQFPSIYVSRNSETVHAEVAVLQYVCEKGCLTGSIGPIVLYITYQPCHKSANRYPHYSCCEKLADLYRSYLKPMRLTLLIKVAYLHKVHWTPNVLVKSAREGIQTLCSVEGISLQRMEADDWQTLWSLCLRRYGESSRKKLDDFVSTALENLRQGVGD